MQTDSNPTTENQLEYTIPTAGSYDTCRHDNWPSLCKKDCQDTLALFSSLGLHKESLLGDVTHEVSGVYEEKPLQSTVKVLRHGGGA